MSQIEIVPSPKPIDSQVEIPPSKSYTNRALLIAALTSGKVEIKNALFSDDTEAMLSCLESFVINIEKINNDIFVTSDISQVKEDRYFLNANLSGTTIRFILALSCLIPGEKILSGEEGLNKRPIKELVEVLRKLGAEIEYLEKEGYHPLKITSDYLNSGEILIDGSISSQYVSALLMIAPNINGITINIENNLISKPYIDMTIDIMKVFGVEVKNEDYKKLIVKSGQKYTPMQYFVEGDYSSASYLFAIAALTESRIKVSNLNPTSKQADKKFLDVLIEMGNKITLDKNEVTIEGMGVKPIEIDMEDFPDQIQTLAVIAAFAKGQTKISGIRSLRIKETNRVLALENELKKMGIKTDISENEMVIHGGEPKPATIDTYGDHRMAMAFAVAGTKIPGMKINNPEVVRKTFPSFWEKLKSIGIKTKGEYHKIFLVGFRGTGKTTLAKKIAEKLNWRFIDSDELIFEKAGENANTLTKNGSDWLRFRQIENEVLKVIVKENFVVVSCGGGIGVNDLLDPETQKTFGELNREILEGSDNCLIILLNADEAVIKERLAKQYKEKKKVMPVLNPKLANDLISEKDEQRLIEKMVEDSIETYKRRKPLYEGLTSIKINTADYSLEDAAEEIIKNVR